MKYILLISFFFFALFVNAQLIHVEGSKTLGISTGYVKNGFNGSFQLSINSKNNISYLGSIDYERIKPSLSVANIVFFNPQVSYNFYSLKEVFFFSVKAGFISGFEFISNDILQKNKNQFFVGESIGLSSEYYLNESILLNLNIDQRFFQRSKLGEASFIIKLGINYNF